MRKLLLLGVVLAALAVACQNKNPAAPSSAGPGGVTVTQTTSTTTTTTVPPAPATTTTTTTTSVVPNVSRRYQTIGAPTLPSDMMLTLQLVNQAPTENEYKVTGVYSMPNGTTGAVKGELGGALNPLETGGEFKGTLTATVAGCTAERDFSGPLGPLSLTWKGAATLADCPGSPLAFDSFTLLRPDAPPLPSTTTSTTTTTALVCGYTLSATAISVPAAGGKGQVAINTLAPCPWTAAPFASWLTVSPASGTGPASLSFTATPNTGGARTGTLVIGGVTLTVTQAAFTPF